jgi:lipopolysaccharide export LptBFGC system permease protein LptF
MLTVYTAAGFGTGGIIAWIQSNLITVLVLLAAVAVLWAARGGNIGKSITIVACLFLGAAVLGLASGNNATDIGNYIVGLLKGA